MAVSPSPDEGNRQRLHVWSESWTPTEWYHELVGCKSLPCEAWLTSLKRALYSCRSTSCRAR
jgi:hypothetical protein